MPPFYLMEDAARRSAFIAQIEQLNPIDVSEELASEDQEIIKLLRDLKSAEAEYPPSLFAARRSAFLRQITIGEYSSLLAELRAFLRKIFQYKLEIPRIPISDVLRTSLVIAGLVVAAFIGSLLFEGRELSTNIKIMKDERQ